MMIVDFNQTCISNFMMSIGNHKNIEIEEGLLRHMILNSLRSYNSKFRATYGEMVIACDSMHSWRKDVFPYYKANRKKNRDDSEIDWKALFTVLETIRNEIKEHFPYRVVQVQGAEADDIIGALVNRHAPLEPVLIISGDKDFRQLQVHPNVKQYDPVRKKYMTEPEPVRYLKEHIIRGDRGDGVPNFLSKDDSLINGRQKPIKTVKVEEWLSDAFSFHTWTEEMQRGFKRNEILVDLQFTPPEILNKIYEDFDGQLGKSRGNLFSYFIEKQLKHLMKDIGDF